MSFTSTAMRLAARMGMHADEGDTPFAIRVADSFGRTAEVSVSESDWCNCETEDEKTDMAKSCIMRACRSAGLKVTA